MGFNCAQSKGYRNGLSHQSTELLAVEMNNQLLATRCTLHSLALAHLRPARLEGSRPFALTGAENPDLLRSQAKPDKVSAVAEKPEVQPGGSAAKPEPIAVMIGQTTPGGSERQLYMFLAFCDRTRWKPVLYVSGALGGWDDAIRKLDIPVILLRGSPLAKMWQFRSACIAQKAKSFFSWSSYTNGFGLALMGLGIHRIGSFRNAYFADLPKRWRWLWGWMSLAGISTAVCNSRETQAQIAERCGHAKHVVYIPNGVEIFSSENVRQWRKEWRARLGLEDDAVLVVGAGRLAPQKNYVRFVDVIGEVRRHLPVRAVIAGEDHGCLPEIKERIAQLGLEEPVRLLGNVPDAHKLACAGDIFLLSSDHEGMPNVILEAMAARVPCVATRVNSITDLIDHGSNGFVAGCDAADLAQYVIRLAADPSLRDAMGCRARAKIEQEFRPETSACKLWKVCEAGD